MFRNLKVATACVIHGGFSQSEIDGQQSQSVNSCCYKSLKMSVSSPTEDNIVFLKKKILSLDIILRQALQLITDMTCRIDTLGKVGATLHNLYLIIFL